MTDRVTITHPDLPDATPTVSRQAFKLSWQGAGWSIQTAKPAKAKAPASKTDDPKA